MIQASFFLFAILFFFVIPFFVIPPGRLMRLDLQGDARPRGISAGQDAGMRCWNLTNQGLSALQGFRNRRASFCKSVIKRRLLRNDKNKKSDSANE